MKGILACAFPHARPPTLCAFLRLQRACRCQFDMSPSSAPETLPNDAEEMHYDTLLAQANIATSLMRHAGRAHELHGRWLGDDADGPRPDSFPIHRNRRLSRKHPLFLTPRGAFPPWCRRAGKRILAPRSGQYRPTNSDLLVSTSGQYRKRSSGGGGEKRSAITAPRPVHRNAPAHRSSSGNERISRYRKQEARQLRL